jgi:hypothetical protein
LDYDPETGLFTRRNTGRVTGTVNNCGFVVIKVDGTVYEASRLAWLYCCGEWPPFKLKHINDDKRDNRIANLIRATGLRSIRWPKPRSRSQGIAWRGRSRKWVAKVWNGTNTVHFGSFSKREDAIRAYDKQRRIIRKALLADAIRERELIQSSVPCKDVISWFCHEAGNAQAPASRQPRC